MENGADSIISVFFLSKLPTSSTLAAGVMTCHTDFNLLDSFNTMIML